VPEQTPQELSREQIRTFRRVLASALAELRSQEVRTSFAAVSLEELVDRQIAELEQDTDPLYPSRLSAVRKLRRELAETVEAVKAQPPEAFRTRDSRSDANTPPEGDGK